MVDVRGRGSRAGVQRGSRVNTKMRRVCVSPQSAAAAPSPVMGNMPPNDGMPGGPMPPGFFQVRQRARPGPHLPRPPPSHAPDSLPAPPLAVAKPSLLSFSSLAVLIPVQMCSLFRLSSSGPYVLTPLGLLTPDALSGSSTLEYETLCY